MIGAIALMACLMTDPSDCAILGPRLFDDMASCEAAKNLLYNSRPPGDKDRLLECNELSSVGKLRT
jgi:hypothetical protein